MKQGVFITGTDTGVGKTFVTCMLLRSLVNKGIKAAGMKPVETGCKPSGFALVPADGTAIKAAAKMQDNINLIVPYMFEKPLSPYAASMIEGRIVEPAGILDSYAALAKAYDFMVVEGAGGLMVPVCSGTNAGINRSAYYYSDLAGDLELPLLIVARAGLGTINHTMLTVRCALEEGLRVVGVVLNSTSGSAYDISEDTNLQVLRNICPVPVITRLSYAEPENDETRAAVQEIISAVLSFGS
ncbi:MAG: dethiobiotin synthase [Nitrospiraceae bacterium]|nr:dethiobiotin synthase [Nitrospiraceae bacterium]